MSYFLKKSIANRLVRTSNTLLNNLNKSLSPYKIAIEQRATLEIIKYEPDVNQITIAKLLGKDKTTISRSLVALEKKELIIKESNSLDDKRSNKIRLTEKGKKVLSETLPKVMEFRENLASKFTKEEQEVFFEMLDRINK